MVFSTSKITNAVCDCCSSNNWSVLDTEKGLYPSVVMSSQDGNVSIPQPHIRLAATVCNNCKYVRFFVNNQ